GVLAAHQPRFFAFPITLFFAFAFVIAFFALNQRDFAFNAAFAVMQIKRHDRIAALFDFAAQLFDFVGMQQQFTRAYGIGLDMRRSSRQRTDVDADQK